jgi:NAD(P)-dependent dehydrogenase (short-subunit alcohol dehydrogenase family)
MSVAIVTGGSSGIGYATALGLARADHDVGITYHRNRAGADELVAQVEALGRRAAAVRLDLTDPSAAEAAIDALAEQLGGELKVLVNNAGVNPRARTLDATLEQWTSTLNANLVGPWACARAATRRMVAAGTGGRIVNVTSVLAFAPLDGGGPYCAAKAGLEMLTKVMALELAEHGIAVNAVAPGHTATPMNYTPDGFGTALAHRPVIPQARAAAAEEIARAICFLARPGASYATGASLVVDGGLLLASGPQQLQERTETEEPE